MATEPGRVSVVIPTLAAEEASLRRAVASVEGAAEVIVVVDQVVGPDPEGTQGTCVVWTGGGRGFAGGAQAGIDVSSSEFVLLLNDDAWLEPGWVDPLVAAMDDPWVAGAAPKVRFAAWPEIVNSVGTVLFADGRADSRGIGQPDVGQYDRGGRVFGCHFAAALVRRSLFSRDSVGPIDSDFRMYYEDIDWCLRANLSGYRFVAVPEARAIHEHSRTTRREPPRAAFAHQQRNLVWMSVKCFQSATAVRIGSRRCAGLVRRGAVDVVGSIMAGLPRVLGQRRAVQRGRRMSDAEMFSLSQGEPIWFDGHEPVFDITCLTDALGRAGVAVDEGSRLEDSLGSARLEALAYLDRLRTAGVRK